MTSEGYKFWRGRLRAAKLVVAPMVDQSELAFRLLTRRFEAQLCYTPMLNAQIFLRDKKYQKESLESTPEDRPLIVQFCANDAQTLLAAARIAAPHCDAVDLNLGCPQSIAKRGHYGAFLQDDWDLIFQMSGFLNLVPKCLIVHFIEVNLVHRELQIPITCKVRIFPEIEKTVEYAKMLENAGASLISVHGRTREQKGPLTGLASWEHIKAVKEAVNIPVFANGNIQLLKDVEACLTQTGADGVMSAEGILHNPALFTGKHLPVWVVAQQYLELAKQYPCPLSYVRGHLFKIFYHCFMMKENDDLREELAKGHTIEEFDNVTRKVKDRYEKFDPKNYDSLESKSEKTQCFLCQPNYNAHKNNQTKRTSSEHENANEPDENDLDDEALKISKRQLKRQKKGLKVVIPKGERAKKLTCGSCSNQKGQNCHFGLCKPCCKKKSYFDKLDCVGHKYLFSKFSKSKNNFIDC